MSIIEDMCVSSSAIIHTFLKETYIYLAKRKTNINTKNMWNVL
jgi:hypothetical protein